MQDLVKADLPPFAQHDLPLYSVAGCDFAIVIVVDRQRYVPESHETNNRVEARNVYQDCSPQGPSTGDPCPRSP
jgi:hypothetical protein